jgi:hypothetical protein
MYDILPEREPNPWMDDFDSFESSLDDLDAFESLEEGTDEGGSVFEEL